MNLFERKVGPKAIYLHNSQSILGQMPHIDICFLNMTCIVYLHMFNAFNSPYLNGNGDGADDDGLDIGDVDNGYGDSCGGSCGVYIPFIRVIDPYMWIGKR